MKNLQNFGVQEMDAREIRETHGGWLGAFLRTAAAIATLSREVEEGIDWYAKNQRKY